MVRPAAEGSSSESSGAHGRGLGTLLVCVPLLALLVSVVAWQWPRSPAPRASGLEVVALEAGAPQEVTLAPVGPDPGDPGTLAAPGVKVSLANDGDVPAVVSRVSGHVAFDEVLLECQGTGGPIDATAMYDADLDRLGPDGDFSVQASFEVGPRSTDAFWLTLGSGSNVSAPRVTVVELTVEGPDGRDRTRAGTVAVLGPTWTLPELRARPFSSSTVEEPCIEENGRALVAALAARDRSLAAGSPRAATSDDLVEITERFEARAAAGGGPEGGRIAAARYPTGASPSQLCRALGQETEILAEIRASAGDGSPADTLLVQTCRPADGGPEELVTFPLDGSPPSVILGAADGIDGRGLRSVRAVQEGDTLRVSSRGFRPEDLAAAPGVFVEDSFVVQDGRYVRSADRRCWVSAEVECEGLASS